MEHEKITRRKEQLNNDSVFLFPKHPIVWSIELKTAPADFRFPTTNQTRHCFTRYIEFHRCTSTKGEESNDCKRFAKYITASSVLENGLRSGTSRGKVELFRVLFDACNQS